MTTLKELVQETTPLGTDVIYILVDPDNTKVDSYITVADFLDAIQVQQIIDVDHAEAFLVRQDADSGDVFLIDTIDEEIDIIADVDITGALDIAGILTQVGAVGITGALTQEGPVIIDETATEALLVRVNADGGDILIVDTTNSDVEVKQFKFIDGGETVDIIRDEDNMATDDENALATQQSIKAYIDTYALLLAGGGTITNDTIIDNTAAEAFLVRIASDGGDIFLVDTTNSEVEITGLIAKTIAKFESEVGQTLVDHSTTGATETIDWTASNLHTCEVDDDCTFTFTAPTNSGHLTLIIEGDGTPRSLTWPATVKWVGAGEPTWVGTDGKKNIISMVWDGTDYIAAGAVAA